MTAKVILKNEKDGLSARIIDNGAVLVSSTPYPAAECAGELSRARLLSGYLGTTGLDLGIINANVDGSVTNQKLYIESDQEYDIYITKLLICIRDSTVTHSGFGALAALTNGVSIVAIEGGTETFLIKNAKTFAELIEQTFAEKPFGDGATAFELTDAVGTTDMQVLPFDIAKLVPMGLRIGRGTLDKVELRIADNLTGLNVFTVRIGGFRLYPAVAHKD